jgi:glycosyltransferase involved in cell wall biosynthesis
MTSKRVSVCMATYNGEKYIYEQLKSILDQLTEEDEVVISDDSSTDNTISIIKSFADNRIVLFKDQQFKNPIYNFENALKEAKGKYIFLADQDDVWMPERVNTILPYFDNYDLVINDCIIVNERLETLHNSYFNIVRAKKGLIRNLLRTSPYIGCCMSFRQGLLGLALPFPKKIPMHDFWIAMLAEARCEIKFIYKPLLLYRRHALNASPTSAKSNNSLLRKISFRIQILRSMITRLFFFNINQKA